MEQEWVVYSFDYPLVKCWLCNRDSDITKKHNLKQTSLVSMTPSFTERYLQKDFDVEITKRL